METPIEGEYHKGLKVVRSRLAQGGSSSKKRSAPSVPSLTSSSLAQLTHVEKSMQNSGAERVGPGHGLMMCGRRRSRTRIPIGSCRRLLRGPHSNKTTLGARRSCTCSWKSDGIPSLLSDSYPRACCYKGETPPNMQVPTKLAPENPWMGRDAGGFNRRHGLFLLLEGHQGHSKERCGRIMLLYCGKLQGEQNCLGRASSSSTVLPRIALDSPIPLLLMPFSSCPIRIR